MSISVISAILVTILSLVLFIYGMNKKKRLFMYLGLVVFCVMITVGAITGNLFDFLRGFADGFMGA